MLQGWQKSIEDQKQYIEEQLEQVNTRMAELEKPE